MKLYDRSRVVTDWTCPRKRYWGYEWEGKGLVGSNIHLELFTGTTLHDGLAAIAAFHRGTGSVDIDAIATTANRQMAEGLLTSTSGEVSEVDFALEQAALVEGLLRGFHKYVWPQLMGQYPNILHIEEEMKYEHDGLTFMSRPDLVIGNDNGDVVYVEYKSTSSKKEGWINSWGTAVQLHSTIKAIEATTGRKVDSVIVQGLYKGFESYGKQSSPFCYGYHRYGNPPFSKTETIYEWKAGFKRTPTWEMEGGVKAWVDGMPPEVIANQFPQTPQIFVNEDMISSFFNQRKWREKEIELAMNMLPDIVNEDGVIEVLDVTFPQKFDQCIPAFGKPCEYRKLCFGHVENPLEEGYQVRVPHHQAELESWNETEVLVSNNNTLLSSVREGESVS